MVFHIEFLHSLILNASIDFWLIVSPFFSFSKQKPRQLEKCSNAAKKSGEYVSNKIISIHSFLRSPTNKLYCLFLSYTIKTFDSTLTALQSEEPKIHVLKRSMERLMLAMFSRFLLPTSVSGKSLLEVNFQDPSNFKSNSDLLIGQAARDFIANGAEYNLQESRVQEFYKDVYRFFTVTCDYLLKKLPFKDSYLKHAEICDVSIKEALGSNDLQFLLDKFPVLLPNNSTKDGVLEELAMFQADSSIAPAKTIIDAVWKGLQKSYPQLTHVMMGILCIPDSSARCEGIFSCVRKNRTD